MRLYNIGFTKKCAEEFFELLKRNNIDCLVDIRLNPNGQLSRFAFKNDLPYLLDKLVDGCAYAHRKDLAPRKELLKERREKGTPMHKDYRLFEDKFNDYLVNESKISTFLAEFGGYKNVVLLCSEASNEECHRRLVSDMLLKDFPNDIQFGGSL
ncbi:MAG: DUF488 domain-containing protein [Coriobacteriales bacterium]|jgi:uncharacterized protein (DUF488 family)|nr:DUF488 domain-containing protein [Coriobacteriales bacterium]